jgi:hypothetical protein
MYKISHPFLLPSYTSLYGCKDLNYALYSGPPPWKRCKISRWAVGAVIGTGVPVSARAHIVNTIAPPLYRFFSPSARPKSIVHCERALSLGSSEWAEEEEDFELHKPHVPKNRPASCRGRFSRHFASFCRVLKIVLVDFATIKEIEIR